MSDNKRLCLNFERNLEQEQKDMEQNFPVLNRRPDLDIVSSLSSAKDSTSNSNILIEGENLHSLMAIQSTHTNKIDVIYIDPPYNTGNDGFVYKDNFQKSYWLTFMEERLKLAKNLLKEDGVIFISIDDRMLYELKILMDELFGGENFIANFIWESRKGGGNDSKNLNNPYEYILTYSKNKQKCNFAKKPVDNMSDYKLSDEYVKTRGKYQTNQLDRYGLRYAESLDYPIIVNNHTYLPGGKNNYKKEATWRWKKEKVEWGIKNGFIVANPKKNKIYTKQYQYCDNEGKSISREYAYSNEIPKNINTKQGGLELRKLFGKKVFDYPKPTSLIKHLLTICGKKDALVLDYFAGSGTTGHAVLDMNMEDDGRRRFIMMTNNENNICRDITRERIKLVIEANKAGNLRYFEARLIQKGDSLDSSNMILSEFSGPIAQITSEMFDVIECNDSFEIFQNRHGLNKFTAILKEEIDLDELLDFIECNDPLTLKNTTVYTCSLDNEPNHKKNISLNMLNSFRRIGVGGIYESVKK